MRERCLNKNHVAYSLYGGSGVTICESWLASFDAFLADMGEPPTPKHSIDRFPNRSGNYEPGNCRWATQKQQANNTRTNRFITFQGETLTMAQWAEKLGLPYLCLATRLNKLQWSLDRALSTPYRGRSYASR